MRGLAILGRWRARRPDDRLCLLIPERLRAWARQEEIHCRCPPAAQGDRPVLAKWLGAALRSEKPDILLVDVFARGLLGELADVWPKGVAAWLVGRWSHPEYYLSAPVRTFIERRYRGLAWGEPPPPELKQLKLRSERVEPILIRRPEECLSREAARFKLGLDAGQRLVMAIGTGSNLHQERLWRLLLRICQNLGGAARSKLVLRFVSDTLLSERSGLDTKLTLFPAMAYMRGADVVIGAGGYHSYHEPQALGVPAIFLPQKRVYDNQFHRVRKARVARHPLELERAMGRILALPPLRGTTSCDGARQVVDLVTDGL